MSKIIGIDLGTTNSAICSFDGREYGGARFPMEENKSQPMCSEPRGICEIQLQA